MTELVEPQPAATDGVSIVELPERRAAVVRIEGAVDELPRLMGGAFQATAGAIGAAGAQFAGPPFARYLAFGERIEAEVGFPFEGELSPAGDVFVCTLPHGRAVTTRHVGPYDGIGATWERATEWMRARDLLASGPAWECYLTGPDEPGPPITEVFWPVG